MCFSTQASFISSAVLLTAGAVTIAKTRTKSQRVFAALPVIFAFQQFCEGFVWLSTTTVQYAHLKSLSIYSFLFFALLVWPLFVPIGILLLEKNKKRRKILFYFAAMGLMTVIFFVFCLCNYNASIEVNPYHIRYVIDFPLADRWYYDILYFIPAFFPMFISSISRMRLLGIILLISYVISRLFFRDYIISVWCFFGALSSIVVFFIISQVVAMDKPEEKVSS